MKIDADNREIERNSFSGRLQKGRDYNTGFTIRKWMTRGSCYARLWKETYLHQKRNEIDEMRAKRR